MMITHVGHGGILRRIGINVGAGYVPGINAVIAGAAQAAGIMGWEIVGIRDGFEGLLHPERYPDGGLISLSPQLTADLNPFEGGILGQSPRIDPFHVPIVNQDDRMDEADLSDEILQRLKAENFDALISSCGWPLGWVFSTSSIAKGSIQCASQNRLRTTSPLLRYPLALTAPSALPSKC